MNNLLNILILVNLLLNHANSVPEKFVKDINSTDDDGPRRIFHGTPATEKDFPYQVSMKAKVRSRTLKVFYTFCGGTIIAPSKVLSAAHCFYNNKKSLSSCASLKSTQKPLSKMYAVAGTLYNVEIENDGGVGPSQHQWRKLTRTIAPHDYVFPRRDIAIVILSKPFVYNDYVNEIPYALEHKVYVGLTCIASGYGRTEKKRAADKLLWAKLEVISTKTCSRMHNSNMRPFVCTSGALTDVGQGDSGGPLVCKNTGHSNEGAKGILVGVTSGKRESRGLKGRSKNAFFTRVSSYKEFIKKCKAQAITPSLILLITFLSFLYTLLVERCS